ncbi:hypothetical protein F5148DRAFT_1277448 [Russula earlei]|uniref:Uncharacterized protein n=1 Tax=Russula earlei TaxID=71964 RepID=A0ACC0TY73_9AGAM|nr:hypothetical protein F5148DRAFT_1277448 [Russula earlei]
MTAPADGSPSPVSTSSEGYPSWLPKRPPPPAPDSNASASGAGAGAGAGSAAGSGPRRQPTDRTTRVSSSTDAAPPHPRFPSLPFLPFLFRSRVWSRASASAIGRPSPTLLSSSQTPDARLRVAIAAPPKFRSPGLHLELLRDPSWKTRLHFYLFPLFVLAHVPLQTYLDFNAVFILIEAAKFPNPDAPGVPGSGRNWVLGAVAYIACWIIWMFAVVLGYEFIYSFYRRWRFRRPLILPVYLSSPAFNFVAMSSYNHFCFLQHIRASAFPNVNPSAVLPSTEGSLRDALAETCYFYAQNLPTIVTLLPRAGLALALLLSFFSPENLPGGLNLSDVDQSIARRDGTFFNKSTGALSGYAKGVLIANVAWAAWRTLVLLLSWYRTPPFLFLRRRAGLWMLSGYGCAGLCGPRSRWEEEEIGRTVSIHSEKSESGLGPAVGARGVDTLPWSWKECTLLRVHEAYEFCLTLRAPRAEKSAEHPPEGGFEGIEKVFAAVGLGGATQPPQGRRGKLSRDLFEGPQDTPSRKSSAANGHGNGHEVVAPPPEALVHETTKTEGDKSAPLKTLPYPFPGFGPRESSEQEQIPFPPSPPVPDDGVEGEHEEGEGEGEEGDIVFEVEVEGEEEGEEVHPRSSEEPSSFSGRASNSLSSLGQPISSRYPFSFRHPARGGSMSSTGSPPFAFSRATATPKSKKSTSTRASHETRSTGNIETASSSHSGGSPISPVAPSSSAPSPQDVTRGMPMPPRHPAAGAGGRQRPATAPDQVSPTPAGGLTATRPRQTFEEHRHLRPDSMGSEILPESDREDDRASRSGQPSPDGSLEAREREDSVGLLSAPSSQPSPRASLLGSRNGSATSLTRIGTAFRPRSRSRNTSSGSGTGSGASSRHNSHVSLSSVSLAQSRARAQSLIQTIGGASRSSIELPSSLAAGAVRLGDSSDADGSEGALSNPENHTFGLPVVGGAGSMLLPRRAGARARTLDSDGRSSASSSSAAAAATSASQSGLARAAVATRVRSSSSLSSERRALVRAQEQQQRQDPPRPDQRSHSQSQPPSPSVLAQSVTSEDTTSGSTRTQTQAMWSQAPSQVQTRAQTPVGVPIPPPASESIPASPPPASSSSSPSSPPLPTTTVASHPGDVSSAPTSFVTTPPTIVSHTTDSGGQSPGSHGGVEHYAPPHTRAFTPH